MVSLRTLLLWLAVVAFGALALSTGVITLAVIIGVGMNAQIWLPVLVVSMAGLVFATIAVQRSSDRDRRELPAYDNALFSWVKAVALTVVSASLAGLAVLVLVNVPDALESETCRYFGGGEGPSFERCATDRDYWGLIPSAVYFSLTFLPAVGGAAVLWRDYLSGRFHLARSH